MITILVYSFGFAIGINFLLGLIAYVLQTDKITDISYALSFLVIVLCGFLNSGKDVVDTILAILLTAWAFRLGYYLLIRIKLMGRDKRFDSFRENLIKFTGFWFVQGLSIAIISIGFLTVFQIHNKSLNSVTAIGLSISFLGLIIEAFADHQKFTFKKKNPNDFMQTGLWKRIRHPNYLGEILFWFGVFLGGCFYFDEIQFLAILSPLWISFLLIKFSGIPILEKQWKNKYANNKKWNTYWRSSYRLVPYVW